MEWLEGSSLVVGLGGHLTVWDASARSSVASFAHRRGPLVAAIPMARRAFCHHGHHNTTSGNSFLLGDCHALAVATQASLCVLDVRTVSASASVAAEWQLSRVRGSRSGTADPVGAFGGVQCMCMVGNHNAIAVGSATGNVAVVKPSELAPGSIIRLGEILAASGAPPGVVNVLPGGAEEPPQAAARRGRRALRQRLATLRESPRQSFFFRQFSARTSSSSSFSPNLSTAGHAGTDRSRQGREDGGT